MARILVVGWDGRAEVIARELRERGHLVRGTSLTETQLPAIDSAGAEGVVADPDRLGTLLPHLQGVSAVCWLAGENERHQDLMRWDKAGIVDIVALYAQDRGPFRPRSGVPGGASFFSAAAVAGPRAGLYNRGRL